MIFTIDKILTMQEGKTLEFKQDLSSPKNFLKTLVAFANTAGGILLIGVEDKTNKVIGVENPLDREERLCNMIADSISPRLVPNVELLAWQDKTLLAVEAYPSGLRPHWLTSEGPAEGVYVRLGSTNRKADPALIEELRRNVAGAAFDELPLPDLSPDALDLGAARSFFKDQRDLNEKELLTLKLIRRVQGRLVPTIGGILLFGLEREIHFSDAWIQCGRFVGKNKDLILDHTEIYDHLPALVERGIDFIKKHAMRGADLSGIRRRDVWSIPLGIVREAVINAVVHADYSQSGAPLRIAIYDDRVEIENPGILLPGLTIDDIRQGVSKLRNKVIGRVFRELGLIEQWGSGIRRMFNEAQALKLPEPGIEEIGMRLRFTVYLAESVSPTLTNSFEVERTCQTDAGSGTKSAPSWHQAGTKSAPSRHQVEILKKCEAESPIADLMALTGRTDRTKFRNRVLNPLLDAGLIEMTIPDKPRSSKQKYRLTENGKNFISRRT